MASALSPAILFVSGRRSPPYDLGAWVRRRGGRPLYAASPFEALQAVVRESPAVALVVPGSGLGPVRKLRRILRRHHPAARVLAVDPRGPARRFVLRALAAGLRTAGAGFRLLGGVRP